MEYKIYWTGTVLGCCTVEAGSLEEAMILAEDESIDIVDYPDDWEVLEDVTKDVNGVTK
jgi:hypothetical protein